MNGKTLAKIGIVVLVVGAIGFVVYKGVNKDNPENETPVVEEQYEDTYIDDGYGDVEDVDLNKEFEDRIETDKEVSENNSSDKKDETTSTNDSEKDEVSKDESSTDKEDSNDKETESKPSKSQSAVFQGFADSSFVEMKIGNEYKTYRVSPDAKPSLSGKNIGDNVTFKFIEENGQLTIVEVN